MPCLRGLVGVGARGPAAAKAGSAAIPRTNRGSQSLTSAAAYRQLHPLDQQGHPSDCQALPPAASLIDTDHQENSSEVHKR